MTADEIIKRLRKIGTARNREGMARFGIRPKTELLGISVTFLRQYARKIGRNHELALELWQTKIHEARILAALVDESERVTAGQINSWVREFDSWDICDTVCSNLIDKTKFANKKIFEFSKRKEEFVRRTAFTLMACLAVHDKKMKDSEFIKFFPLIKKYSTDERNFVRKAVNWALRQIGKRNKNLNRLTLTLAEEIKKIDSRSARWIASDAIRELKNKKF